MIPHDGPGDGLSDELNEVVGAWLRETDADPSTALARLHAQMASSTTPGRPVGYAGKRDESGWRQWSAVAAVFLVLVGAFATWRVAASTTPQAVREFVTPAGSRMWVTLRDGTKFTLGPATRLRVPADFGRHGREVDLDGEAVFAVVHNIQHPFAVHTRLTTIRDVGTTFSVHAYAEDADERVAVTEGEVSIGGAAVRAGSRAVVRSASDIVLEPEADVATDAAWAQGGLVFRQTPLPDALKEVERVYDLTITIADSSLRVRTVTASFSGEPIEEVLDAITRTVGASYVRSGKKIVVSRKVRPIAIPTAGGAIALGRRDP